MSHPDTTSKDAVFQWRGIPQPGQLLPLGLQHVVAAVVGVITPAILVADTCGLSSADKTLMISDPDRPGHPAPALSHLPPHRLRPARHHGH